MHSKKIIDQTKIDTFDQTKIDTFGQAEIDALFSWFEIEKRALPWRIERSAYRVWLSEIMLQQTRASTVIPYFERFVQRYPHLRALAAADEQEVLKLWEGLGYYSRARNILQTARVIQKNYGGHFPLHHKDLLKLPGIGPYTAAAISSLAGGEAVAAVDGNVLRVIARRFDLALQRQKPADLNRARDIIQSYYEKKSLEAGVDPATFNESLIELGALICLPQNPACPSCPLHVSCLARAKGHAATLPLPPAQRSKAEESYTVLLMERLSDHKVLVQQRPTSGLLASLWEFPLLDEDWEAAALQDMLEARHYLVHSMHALPTKKHVFSHKIWHLYPRHILVSETALFLAEACGATHEEGACLHDESEAAWEDPTKISEKGLWVDKAELHQLTFSSALAEFRELI